MFDINNWRRKPLVTVNSRRIDGKIRRSWQAHVVSEDAEWSVLAGEFAETVRHSHLGTIVKGTFSLEFYHKTEWYNVFAFYQPDGFFRNFYCNINLPPKLSADSFDYIDLDLDILIWDDGKIEILDMDDFEKNSRLYRYESDLCAKAWETLEIVQEKYRQRVYPFTCPQFLAIS